MSCGRWCSSTRIAPEVAADATMVRSSVPPTPMFAHSPSATGANQRASESPCQRAVRSGSTSGRDSWGSRIGDSFSSVIPAIRSIRGSQLPERRFSRPVHAAVAVPAAVVPSSRSYTYSPMLSHRSAASKSSGRVSRSHRKRGFR